MASIRCDCGYLLDLTGPVPNRLEWRVVKDGDLLEYVNSVRFERDPTLEQDLKHDEEWEAFSRKASFLFRCPNSGHIWIFWEGWNGPISYYLPESP